MRGKTPFVYRGFPLPGTHTHHEVVKHLESTGLGQHWSGQEWVARRSSTSPQQVTRVVMEGRGWNKQVERDPEELKRLQVQGPDGWEEETTFRKGEEIHVSRIQVNGRWHPVNRPFQV